MEGGCGRQFHALVIFLKNISSIAERISMRRFHGLLPFVSTLAFSTLATAAEPATYAPAPEGRALSIVQGGNVTG